MVKAVMWMQRRWKVLVGCGLFITVMLGWHALMQAHGTVGLQWVYTHTLPYPGPAFDPPSTFSRKFRLVVSLSTRPDRMTELIPTLRSIIEQTDPADAIYINVPLGVNKRSGVAYTIPDSLRRLPGVTILRCSDVGPLTKLLPALEYEDDPSTVVVTIDDDKIYPSSLLRTLAWHVSRTSNTVVGVCGWSLLWFPDHWISIYVPYFMRPGGGVFVDILQGVCGIAYTRGYFNTAELRDVPKPCFTIDDVWVSGYLATHGISRAIISTRLDPDERPDLTAKSSKWALSSTNSKNLDVYDLCYDAVSERFGHWERIREYQDGAPVPTQRANVTLPIPYDAGVYPEP